MTPNPPLPSESLDDLRTSIDAVDREIIALLERRVSFVKQVGERKTNAAATCFIRSGREASMMRALTKIAPSYPKSAIATIRRMIISASLNMENPMSLQALCLEGDATPLLLAREYFGSFIPMTQQHDPHEVLRQLAAGETTIAVMPPPATHHWWRLLVDFPDLRIFTHLPVVISPHFSHHAFAIAAITPEQTGDDHTFVVSKEEKINDEMAIASSDGYYLYDLAGYLTHDTLPFADMQIIGYYAAPLTEVGLR